jgi:BolA protein
MFPTAPGVGSKCKVNIFYPHFSLKMHSGTTTGPVESRITEKLQEAFQPLIHLQVLNESYMHNVPKGSETHFKVVVVSDQFDNKNLVARHRAVNETLSEELSSGVHALSIVAKTATQWSQISEKSVEPSPKCRGGFGK